MREEALNKINNNIIILNAISITESHTDVWRRQQFITKYHILLLYLEENENIDMDKFCPIVKATHKGVDELISKWE